MNTSRVFNLYENQSDKNEKFGFYSKLCSWQEQ